MVAGWVNWRAPLVRNGLHAPMERDGKLEQVFSENLVDGECNHSLHALGRHLIEREVSVRIDSTL